MAEGNLVITDSWPGQMRTVYGDHQRFVDTYFSTFENDTLQVMEQKGMMMDFIG